VIDFDFTPRDEQLIDLARGQGLVARQYARHYDRAHGELVPDALPEAAEAPNVRALLAEHVGDTSGWALIDALLFLEEVWGTIPFRKSANESAFLGGKLVKALGTQEQSERWANLQIAIALTEPEAGSDPSRIRTTAVWDQEAEEWVVNGEKIFISLAQTADALLVFSRFVAGDDKGMGIFIIEKGTPGLTVGAQLDKLGQRSWDTADFVMIDCRLPAGNRLTGSMKHTLSIFNSSRPLVSAIGLGFSRAALDLTREVLIEAGHDLSYRHSERQLSAPVARFMELEAAYQAAFLTLLHTKWTEDVSGADKIEASITKTSAAKAARRITDGCLTILGLEASSERHLIEMWLRDARVCDIYEGPGEVNRLILARELLGYSPAELS
jgi:acyl-CoA dehydrogenase